MFIKHGAKEKVAILIVYVDDIIITISDEKEVKNPEDHLATSFDIKALGLLTYFLGIEVAYLKS